MQGLTAAQLVERLDIWCNVIRNKISSLKKGTIFYKLANLFSLIAIGVLSITLIGIESYFLSTEDMEYSTKLGLNITIVVLQVILAIFNTFIGIVQPGSKSSDCGTCAKQYSELLREMELVIDKYSNCIDDPDIVDEYFTNCLYYSTREQIILLSEPVLVWFGHKSGRVTGKLNGIKSAE